MARLDEVMLNALVLLDSKEKDELCRKNHPDIQRYFRIAEYAWQLVLGC